MYQNNMQLISIDENYEEDRGKGRRKTLVCSSLK